MSAYVCQSGWTIRYETLYSSVGIAKYWINRKHLMQITLVHLTWNITFPSISVYPIEVAWYGSTSITFHSYIFTSANYNNPFFLRKLVVMQGIKQLNRKWQDWNLHNSVLISLLIGRNLSANWEKSRNKRNNHNDIWLKFS